MAAAPSLKVDIPVPAEKNSKAFTTALKVCLAAAAFDVPLQYSTGI
jgi:methionyl-tRNA synthetase